jgi:hypothetical protein
MERKTIKELMDEIKQCANNWELNKIVDNLKEDTYYYFVYFDDVRPCCIVRKFKNAMWQNGFPYCSIYDTDNYRPITFLANTSYNLVQEKDYIYVKFDSGYAGVFYITKSLQTAHNVLRKECRKRKFNLMKINHENFYKDCMKRLKEFVTNHSLSEITAGTDTYNY